MCKRDGAQIECSQSELTAYTYEGPDGALLLLRKRLIYSLREWPYCSDTGKPQEISFSWGRPHWECPVKRTAQQPLSDWKIY
jgi:hypothetical protein